jgi:hypothetical protein
MPPHLRRDQKSNLPANPSSVSPPYVTQVSIVKGCFYYHNKYKDENGLYPYHRRRNKCPWFRHYLVVDTCHLNNVEELCLGPKLVGRQGIPLPFWNSKISQGEQAKHCTDGISMTKYLQIDFGILLFSDTKLWQNRPIWKECKDRQWIGFLYAFGQFSYCFGFWLPSLVT